MVKITFTVDADGRIVGMDITNGKKTASFNWWEIDSDELKKEIETDGFDKFVANTIKYLNSDEV